MDCPKFIVYVMFGDESLEGIINKAKTRDEAEQLALRYTSRPDVKRIGIYKLEVQWIL